MLRELRIHHFAILPETTVRFSEGLNVLTGETGAGKSILVDAISLLAGRRASNEEIRAGEKVATIEGVIELAADGPLSAELTRLGAPSEGGELVLRRTISEDGRNRVWINGWQGTVAALAELAPVWIDLSGQHGQQALLFEESHLGILDAYAGALDLVAEVRIRYARLRETEEEVSKLQTRKEETAKALDFLTFQLKELKEANLCLGEEEELKAKYARLAHTDRLVRATHEIENLLDGEEGVCAKISRVATEVRGMEKLDPSLEETSGRIEEVEGRLGELSVEVSRYRRGLEFEPGELEGLDGRIAKLQSIARKYGSMEKAIAERDRIAAQLTESEDFSDRLNVLTERRKMCGNELVAEARKLTEIRRKTSKTFERRVTEELQQLGMPDARFSVILSEIPQGAGTCDVEGKSFGSEGGDTVQFQLAPNPGEGFRPLAKIASGGELSRILLGIKGVALAKSGSVDVTFLFDEVDSGIGGETAERVGIRMKALAQGRQVLCVTHLAQIACYSDHHLRVEKEVRSGRTEGRVVLLDSKRRKDELARMIGGITISDKTLAHAAELLKRGSGSVPVSIHR